MSMWEPFSDAARRSIVEAHQVAERFASPVISQEHLFVGIADAGESPAAQALASLGVSGERVDDAAGRVLKSGEGGKGEMAFTGDAKRVIERAFDEARRLQHRYIGAEHLLLGYLREYGRKSELMRELGLQPDVLKAKVLECIPQAVEPQTQTITTSNQGLDDCYALLGGDNVPDLGVEAAWDALRNATAEKNLGAVLAYGFLIGRRSGLSASETAKQIIDEVMRRFDE